MFLIVELESFTTLFIFEEEEHLGRLLTTFKWQGTSTLCTLQNIIGRGGGVEKFKRGYQRLLL
jgi:hypothetical protein